jgi:hypothetical protein
LRSLEEGFGEAKANAGKKLGVGNIPSSFFDSTKMRGRFEREKN